LTHPLPSSCPPVLTFSTWFS